MDQFDILYESIIKNHNDVLLLESNSLRPLLRKILNIPWIRRTLVDISIALGSVSVVGLLLLGILQSKWGKTQLQLHVPPGAGVVGFQELDWVLEEIKDSFSGEFPRIKSSAHEEVVWAKYLFGDREKEIEYTDGYNNRIQFDQFYREVGKRDGLPVYEFINSENEFSFGVTSAGRTGGRINSENIIAIRDYMKRANLNSVLNTKLPRELWVDSPVMNNFTIYLKDDKLYYYDVYDFGANKNLLQRLGKIADFIYSPFILYGEFPHQ